MSKTTKKYYVGFSKFQDDERYFKKLKDGSYKLISISKILREQFPKRYKRYLRDEKLRYRKYYKTKCEKVQCECGTYVKEISMRHHVKYNKHKKLMNLIHEELLKIK